LNKIPEVNFTLLHYNSRALVAIELQKRELINQQYESGIRVTPTIVPSYPLLVPLVSFSVLRPLSSSPFPFFSMIRRPHTLNMRAVAQVPGYRFT
jgi:hypothetical protein